MATLYATVDAEVKEIIARAAQEGGVSISFVVNRVLRQVFGLTVATLDIASSAQGKPLEDASPKSGDLID